VEIHLFRDRQDRLVAFLTKAASVPFRVAQDLARQAVEAVGPPERPASRLVMDAGSIPTSGSL
jgi:hypothetical protein